jgi:hypothetical protein
MVTGGVFKSSESVINSKVFSCLNGPTPFKVNFLNRILIFKFKNPHPKKGKESTKWSEEAKLAHKKRMKETSTIRGKTWKLIDGKRVWLPKEASV